ncbi:hypothetical protein CMEL01_14980, partial [Colletotrichum melonis]
FNPAVSSEGRCPHVRWFHRFHCEKVYDARIQEPNNAEAANIGFDCQQWGNHRVAVPLEYMPAHLRSALSRKTRVGSNGYLVGDTFSTNAQASSSSSESHLSSSETSSNGPNMILRLREKTEEVNRMYGSLMLLPPNSPYPQIIGLERKDHYFTHPFDAVGLGVGSGIQMTFGVESVRTILLGLKWMSTVKPDLHCRQLQRFLDKFREVFKPP